jgi:GT2 family glycosyltransferase
MSGVSVVIPNWNRRDLLLATLRSLATQTSLPETVFVVDNGSTDGSAEEASSAGATVLRLDRNQGFARAVNRGLARVATPWVVILNNDVELAPDYLAVLHASVASTSCDFATGRICSARDRESPRIDATFDLPSRGACTWRAGHGLADGPPWETTRLVQFAPMTAALFRNRLFHDLGCLDEEFDSYLEDVEFGFRCARAGKVGLYVPSARAWHWGSATWGAGSAEMLSRLTRNQLWLVARHYPLRWPGRLGRAVAAAQLLWFLHLTGHGHLPAWWRGFYEGLRRFSELRRPPGPVEAARLLQALEQSEADLLQLQRATGIDRFWRWYQRLAPLPRKS